MTATKSGMERNQTEFPSYFVEAFAEDKADADKDQRVSMLEAFLYARREVERFYEKGRLLATEHAILDDDGDGAGTAAPAATAGQATGRWRARCSSAEAAERAPRTGARPPPIRAWPPCGSSGAPSSRRSAR